VECVSTIAVNFFTRCATFGLAFFLPFAWRSDAEAAPEVGRCAGFLGTCDRQAHDSANSASLQSSARTSELANNEHSASETIQVFSAVIVSPLAVFLLR